jgi:hypothetical protein
MIRQAQSAPNLTHQTPLHHDTLPTFCWYFKPDKSYDHVENH